MELLELLQKRRSIRKYTGEHIPEDKLERILQAGLLAPSSRAIYPVELVVTGDKEKLLELSKCKVGSAAVLADADAAIIVIGDTEKSDAWIEDCSIAMILMQLEATELGIGSCWVQCRGRTTPQGTGTEDHIFHLHFAFRTSGYWNGGHFEKLEDVVLVQQHDIFDICLSRQIDY